MSANSTADGTMSEESSSGNNHNKNDNKPVVHDETKWKKASAAAKKKKRTAAEQLLDKANGILAKVEEYCDIVRKNQKEQREYPTFEASQIKIGPMLGQGAFGIVLEIEEFVNDQNDITPKQQNESNGIIEGQKDEGNDNVNKGDDEILADMVKRMGQSNNDTDNDDVEFPDDYHTNAKLAKSFMIENVRRGGDARYALKRLHSDLKDMELSHAIIDLANETKLLSVLTHPNIIHMRAYSPTQLKHTSFIILDRLYETLDQRIEHSWKQQKAICNHGSGLFHLKKNKELISQFMLERLLVAFDLASAFHYMHENNLVYRDIKQDNIGFDVRGDVKIFDFGLSKGLLPSLKAKDSKGKHIYGYKLTPRTGSVPYMAPEIVEAKPYDGKCDVFSFSILLWEMLSLKKAYDGYTKPEFARRVVRCKERPSISKGWPQLTKMMIKEAWDHDPEKRPTMKRVAFLLKGDMKTMSDSDKILDRSSYMKNKSMHSFRLKRNLLEEKK